MNCYGKVFRSNKQTSEENITPPKRKTNPLKKFSKTSHVREIQLSEHLL